METPIIVALLCANPSCFSSLLLHHYSPEGTPQPSRWTPTEARWSTAKTRPRWIPIDPRWTTANALRVAKAPWTPTKSQNTPQILVKALEEVHWTTTRSDLLPMFPPALHVVLVCKPRRATLATSHPSLPFHVGPVCRQRRAIIAMSLLALRVGLVCLQV